MATITVNTTTSLLPRDELARFLPTPRAVRAFEGMQTDVTETIPGAIGQIVDLTNALLAAPYITWAETPTLENERTLAITSALTLTNTGSQIILGLRETGFAAGFYGSATQTIGVRLDLYGRVTEAEVYELVSDNVAEGAANLYYTDERARAALSGGAGISYDQATGEIAVDVSAIASGAYTPTVAGIANVTAVTAYPAHFTRVFDVCTVSMRLDISPTSTGADTQIGISLPVPSDLTAAAQCCGTAACNSAQQSGAVLADPTNNRAILQYRAADAVPRSMYLTFQYRVL